MKDIERIFSKIDEYAELTIKIQRELVKRPALSPENGGTGEHEKMEYIRGLLEALGPNRITSIDAPDERARFGFRPNLIASFGPSPGPGVQVLSHVDVVPPGDLALWQSDPYELRVENDMLIGRGVEDNNHGLVSSYLALKAIMDLGLELGKRVDLIAVSDEETGSRYGLRYVLENCPQAFSPEDLIVVPDGGNEDGTMIEVAEKSMLWLEIRVKGAQCHASTPHKGKNAFYAASKFISNFDKIRQTFNQIDPLFSPPTTTIEPTKVLANVPNVNSIPGLQVFYVDCRVLPGQTLECVMGAFREVGGEIERELGVEIEITPVLNQKAAPPTSVESPVVKALEYGIRKALGREGVPRGIGGGTVAAFFREKGIPAAVWCTSEDSAHQPNEWCRISTILRDAKVFACLYTG